MKPENPDLFCDPDEPVSKDEARAFALLLLPIYEAEWQRAMSSPSPDWNYLLILHLQMVDLKKGVL